MAICGQVGSHCSFFQTFVWTVVAGRDCFDFEDFPPGFSFCPPSPRWSFVQPASLHLHLPPTPTHYPTFVSSAYRAFDIEQKKKKETGGKCMPNVCPFASPIYADIFLCLCVGVQRRGGEGGKRSSGIKNIFIVIKRTFFYYYYFASLSGTNDANYSNVSGRYFLFSASMSFRSCIYISAATRLCLELLVYYLLIAISVTKPISSVSQMILAPSPKLPALNRKCFLHSLPTNNEYSPVKQWQFYIVLRVPDPVISYRPPKNIRFGAWQ